MEDMGVITDGIRALFATLDKIIYSFVSIIYNLTIKLASISVFDTNTLSTFSTKIYQVMGLFMLFKVSFSFLTYIVDPDAMTDKTKGAATIVKNIIIVLIMIIAAPFVFDKMADVQKLILDEHIIERFVFSKGTTGNHVSNLSFQMNEEVCEDDFVTAASDGDFIALSVFSGFYQPEKRVEDFGENKSELKSSEYLYCLVDSDLDSEGATVADYLHAKLYNRANGTGDWDIYNVNYMFLWSTIVGVVLILLFLNVCIDIAKRAVKLGFLELIAPIPIISYIDPKSGKDGTFKKWLKMLGSTWASLFIRLGSIYFAVYMVELIVQNMYMQTQSIWIRIFIIFGALTFAKELPKLLEELIPGLKTSGAFNLNPMKNIRENTVGGKSIGALGAAGIGFAGGLASNALAFKNRFKKDGAADAFFGRDKDGNTRKFLNGKTGIRAFGAGANSIRRAVTAIPNTLIGGGASAGYNSFWATQKNGNTFSGAAQGITTSSNNRNLRRESGYDLRDKVRDKYTDLTGIKSSSGTTSFLKNKTNENSFKMENAKRDEAAAAYALQQLAMANDGEKFKEFQKAFESTSSINKNTHGIDVTYKYNDYSSYQAANSGSSTMLTQTEFDNYRSALDMRNSADSLAHQLQYENESIAKQQQGLKGQKK